MEEKQAGGKKKIRGILIAISLIYAAAGFHYEVSAATVFDSVSDNTIATANAIHMGNTVRGSITETDDLDYYKFQLGSAGCVTLDMTSYMQYYCIKIFDSNGEEIR